MTKKKTIIISGANLFGGGTLSIFKECLQFADEFLSSDYKVIALVHDEIYFDNYKNITLVPFERVRKSYFHRLYYEYWHYKELSIKLNPYLWLSLNDMSSNVIANRRAVYCHNPTPFKRLLISDLKNQPQVFFFTLFYKYLYKINIRKNDYVIVQQNWLRIAFSEMFKLKLNKIIVATPNITVPAQHNQLTCSTSIGMIKFCFPSFPRPFKNIELICEAVKILQERNINNFKVYITIDGKENRYSAGIIHKYKGYEQIEFIGLITRSEVYELYNKSDCLIFPSTLETWGLPITEFKHFKKIILLADLPYAHETLGDYDNAAFFDPTNPHQLAQFMENVINNKFVKNRHNADPIEDPYAPSWLELFNILLDK
jgi:glycosyltransferase involved in cell wall biosynthesis